MAKRRTDCSVSYSEGNGKDDKEDRVLKLSDSFPGDEDHSISDVEVQVHMYNIRPQYKSDLLESCKTLSEYSWFIEKIRKNSEKSDGETAVDKALRICLKILR